MTRRALVSLFTVVAVTIAGGCGSATRHATPAVKIGEPEPAPGAPTGPVLLAQFDTGVGAVGEPSPTPIWLEPNSVAALDGTSVFVVRHDGPGGADRLVRLDPRTGAVMLSWPLPAPGLSVSVVAPKARWIALTDRRPGYGSQGRTSTELAVFDTTAGEEIHHLTLAGDVQPEAFSIDATFLFALSYSGDHYRVQTVDLATGARYDTNDRYKLLPKEDMHGHAIHGVMSKDRTLLATLYRNPGDTNEPAFVHVLDLQHGWSFCADLPAPFGTGPPGTDVIDQTRADTVVVAATDANKIAEIHINDVRTPASAPDSPPVRVGYRDGAVTLPDTAFRTIPGFDHLITEPS